MKKLYSPFLTVALTAAFASTAALAETSNSIHSLSKKAIQSGQILDEWTSDFDRAIPRALLDASKCIVVIPNTFRIAFVGGVRFGEGLASCRTPSGWSNPTFVNFDGPSVGWQAGIQATDVVLVFTRENAQDRLSKGNITLGADASLSIGPVGRNAEAGTDWILRSEIWSYSRSRGLFAGISLQGTLLKPDKSDNMKVYGAEDASSILMNTTQTPDLVRPYVDALERHAPTATAW